MLSRMQEDGDAGAGAIDAAKTGLPQMVAYEHVAQRDSGYYFLDHVSREARTAAGIPNLTHAGITVHTTIRPDLQHAAEAALQEGLAAIRDAQRPGRMARRRGQYRRRRAQAPRPPAAPKGKPAWQQALTAAHAAALRRALDHRRRARNRRRRTAVKVGPAGRPRGAALLAGPARHQHSMTSCS